MRNDLFTFENVEDRINAYNIFIVENNQKMNQVLVVIKK